LEFADGTYDLVGIFGIFTLLLLRYAMDYHRERKNGKANNPNGGKVLVEILGQLKGIRTEQNRVVTILTARGLDQTLNVMNERLAVLIERTKK